MKLIRSCFRLVLVLPHLLYAVIILLFFVGSDPDQRNERDWRRINHWMRWLCKILGIKITVHGKACAEPALYVANHISWHDIVILQSILQTGFISKSEIRSWPLVGWMAYRGSTLFIQRGTHDAFFKIKHDMTERLQKKQSVLFFPEGTTGNGHNILRFKPRLFEPAILSGARIQAIALNYNATELGKTDLAFHGEISFLRHILQTLGEKQIHIQVYFCSPVSSKGKTAKELALETQTQVEHAFSLLNA